MPSDFAPHRPAHGDRAAAVLSAVQAGYQTIPEIARVTYSRDTGMVSVYLNRLLKLGCVRRVSRGHYVATEVSLPEKPFSWSFTWPWSEC